jgi:hypothetical protein
VLKYQTDNPHATILQSIMMTSASPKSYKYFWCEICEAHVEAVYSPMANYCAAVFLFPSSSRCLDISCVLRAGQEAHADDGSPQSKAMFQDAAIFAQPTKLSQMHGRLLKRTIQHAVSTDLLLSDLD